jgi:hypothetical protein
VDTQKALVETWRAAGFAPFSINSAVEHERHPGLRKWITSLGVQAMVVERPASLAFGGGSQQPGLLCTLPELLAAIQGMQPTGAVAIINADIGMSAGVTAQGISAAAEATGYVIGQRLDVVTRPGSGTRSVQTMDVNGIDFVAFRPESVPGLKGLLPVGLRFGMPWWDHYLPLSLLALGCRPQLLRVGSLWHVRHAPQWSLDRYTRDGLTFASEFAERLQSLPQTLPVCTWLQLFRDRFQPDFARSGMDHLMRYLIQAGLAPAAVIRNRVAVLAGQNVSLLLQAAAAEQ